MERSITTRLGVILTNLRLAVSERIALGLITKLMIIRICDQVMWIERRLNSALARAAAGKPPCAYRPRPRQEPDTETPITPRPRKLPMPRREGWLLPLVRPIETSRHSAAGYRSQLRALLADPDMAPYLTHPSVVRALRPVCRMLGITDALPPQPPKPTPTPVERISEVPYATATAHPLPTPHPNAPPPSQTTSKPRPIRRIPPRRLKLPLPYPA